MTHNLSVFGLGYVGTVTAACLAHRGHRVIGVDVNPAKVEALETGRSPIIEPGIGNLISQAHQSCRLHATTSPNQAVMDSGISFICVGTPGLANGKLDLSHLRAVCTQIGGALRSKTSFHLVVLRSTVLPGTTETVVIPALEEASAKAHGKDFGVCVNPEFMREGSAVADFQDPQVTVIGTADPRHGTILRELYDWVPGKVFETSLRPAEMLKYAGNSWHALKVSFANEMGTLAKEFQVDAESLYEMFVADTRLNTSPEYLRAGFGFGGSCLPKDLRALNYRAQELDVDLPLLNAILPSNEQHLQRALHLILQTGRKEIALLGLSFKAATDDLRESPQVQLAKWLIGEGKNLRIWDEDVALGRLIGSNREYIENVIPHIGTLLGPDLDQALLGAEVVVIATRGIEPERLRKAVRPGQLIIDLVNLEKNRRPDAIKGYAGICW